MGAPRGLSLSELISHVANELRDARQQAQKINDPVLEFSGCELEMAVTLKTEGKAGIQFWLVDAGFSGDRSTVSKVKLNFGRPTNVDVQFGAIQLEEEVQNPKKKQKDQKKG